MCLRKCDPENQLQLSLIYLGFKFAFLNLCTQGPIHKKITATLLQPMIRQQIIRNSMLITHWLCSCINSNPQRHKTCDIVRVNPLLRLPPFSSCITLHTSFVTSNETMPAAKETNNGIITCSNTVFHQSHTPSQFRSMKRIWNCKSCNQNFHSAKS